MPWEAIPRAIPRAMSSPTRTRLRTRSPTTAPMIPVRTTVTAVSAGKPPGGTVKLRAFHEAGQVVIEIADDGKGIDAQKVASAALSRGLVTADQLKAMSAADKLGLIFLPGLSTAEKVTDVSGRGVGMDVVKTNLDRLGGKVEISSEPGRGTLFRIKLPLTLAIIPSLIVSMGAAVHCDGEAHSDDACACVCHSVVGPVSNPDGTCFVAPNPSRFSMEGELFVGQPLPADIFRPPAAA